MTVASLSLQGSLFETDPTTAGDFSDLGTGLTRTLLSHGAWVDHRAGWLNAPDDLFVDLLRDVPWLEERRQMYDRVVEVPRLLAFYDARDALPHPLLTEARERASDHYRAELGERFATSGLCLYRDGRDSVAWHGDRIGRSRTSDTMVAILSLGESRKLLLRPNGGGAGQTRTFTLGHGDLLVMGGSCQRTWEHSVPKTTRPCAPRISVQLRPRGVL